MVYVRDRAQSTPLTTPSSHGVQHMGTEGLGICSSEEIASLFYKWDNHEDAARFIVRQCHTYPGEVVIVALGQRLVLCPA